MEFALTPGDLMILGKRPDRRSRLRRDYRHHRTRRQEPADFGLAHRAGPDKQDGTSVELDENREQGHMGSRPWALGAGRAPRGARIPSSPDAPTTSVRRARARLAGRRV